MRGRAGVDGLEPVEQRVRDALTELTDTTETAEDAWLRINERAAVYERRRRWWPFRARPTSGSGARVWRLTSATLAVALAAVLVGAVLARSDRNGSSPPGVATGGPVRFANAVVYAPRDSEAVSVSANQTVCEAFHYEGNVLVCDQARGLVALDLPAEDVGVGATVSVFTEFGTEARNLSLAEEPLGPSASGPVPESVTVAGRKGVFVTTSAESGLPTTTALVFRGSEGEIVRLQATADTEVPRSELLARADSLEPTDVEVDGPIAVVVATESVSVPSTGSGEVGDVTSAPYDLVARATEDAACAVLVPAGTTGADCEFAPVADDRIGSVQVAPDLGTDQPRLLYGIAPPDAVAVRVAPERGQSAERPTVGDELRAPGRFFLVPVHNGAASVVGLDADGEPIGEPVEVTIEPGTSLPAATHHFTGDQRTIGAGTTADGRPWELVSRASDRGLCFGLDEPGRAVPDRCVADETLRGVPDVAFVDQDFGVLVGVTDPETAFLHVLWSDGTIARLDLPDAVDGRVPVALTVPAGLTPQVVGRYSSDGEHLGQVAVYEDPPPIEFEAPAPDAERDG